MGKDLQPPASRWVRAACLLPQNLFQTVFYTENKTETQVFSSTNLFSASRNKNTQEMYPGGSGNSYLSFRNKASTWHERFPVREIQFLTEVLGQTPAVKWYNIGPKSFGPRILS